LAIRSYSRAHARSSKPRCGSTIDGSSGVGPGTSDIFRGRYRNSLEHPSAIPAGHIERYHFVLPHASHVFLPDHRLMVQIQSSWFSLYDRDRTGDTAGFISLPVVSPP
jgi:predicted acyl esterase